MQIIEVTDLGVRSAVISLQRRQSPLRFILFPMIHLGRPEFYAAVRQRVGRCCLVVAEGHERTDHTRRPPSLVHRLMRRHRRSRLVLQPECEAELSLPVVRPDLTLEEIDQRLRRLPVLTYVVARLTLRVVVPWVTDYVLLVGARAFPVNELALDDDTPDTQPSVGERWDAIERVIGDDRDALLLDALSTIHDERGAEPIDVAVVYGARHMPAIIRGLHDRHGYQARDAEWLTVFDLDD